MNKNEHNIDLLYNHPDKFIETHQSTIEIIAGNFVRSGLLRYSEKDDMAQYVNEKLIGSKIKLMQQHYDRSYYLITYLSMVIRNLCLEYISKKTEFKKKEVTVNVLDVDFISDDSPTTGIIINEELDRLDAVLQLFHKTKPKLQLCLKVLIGNITNADDVKAAFPNCSNKDTEYFLNKCNPQSDENLINEKEMYVVLTGFFNKYGKKQNTPDALRKWMDVKFNEIIDLMNGEPKQAEYTKETLKILLQKYYT